MSDVWTAPRILYFSHYPKDYQCEDDYKLQSEHGQPKIQKL